MAETSKSELTPLLSLDPSNFSELVDACRKIIGAWLDMERDLSDDFLTEFISIESQADDVLSSRWGKDRADDEADFYGNFYSIFIEERDRLRSRAANRDLTGL